MTDANSHQSTAPSTMTRADTTTRADTSRIRVGLAVVAALGLTSAAVVGTQLGDADALDGSLDAIAYTRAQALDEAAADRSSGEVIRLTSSNTAGDTDDVAADGGEDDGFIPSSDEVADTVGDIVSTVGDRLVDVGECILEFLPAVFSGSADNAGTSSDEAAGSVCADLLPTAADFGALDLSGVDLDALDVADVDLGSLDPTELGLPTDFDLGDIDLGELTDVELPDLGEFDTQVGDLDIGSEVLDVISDVADEVVEFFEELPGNVSDRFDGLFGRD